jgi:diaminopimelate epimerase
MTEIPFLKVQGTGNDFVLVDGRRAQADWQALAPALCDRHFGIGSDGLLVVTDSDSAPVRMRMFNPDGSEAEMCGNGLRTLVKYAVERGGVDAPNGALDVETGAGVLHTTFSAEHGSIDRVRIDMGAPILAPADIPVAAPVTVPVRDLALEGLQVDGRDMTVTCLSIGNPHAVHFTDAPVDGFPLDVIGPRVETHPRFPNRVNFEVVNVLAPDHLRVRVWERGAGLTLGCGTGACAALAAARLHDRVANRATVSLPGGDLTIEWDGQGPIFLDGPADYVFEGSWSSDGHA